VFFILSADSRLQPLPLLLFKSVSGFSVVQLGLSWWPLLGVVIAYVLPLGIASPVLRPSPVRSCRLRLLHFSASACTEIAGSSSGPATGSSQSAGMEDIVDLGDTGHFSSAQAPAEEDCDYGAAFLDSEQPLGSAAAGRCGAGRSRGRTGSAKSASGPSRAQSTAPHKQRGPNWTEQEMLVLIGQKHIEWDGRHNCSQPSLAKFVYGTTAWKLVLSGCMSVVGFRERDADQLTNKWDGLIKDYKKLKDYIEGSGSANWWGMNREGKRELCKTRKLPLEFSEGMYNEMEAFVGKRQIFGRAADVVDSDRLSSPPSKQFSRSPPSPRAAAFAVGSSPASSATTTPVFPLSGTPGDDMPGST
jgi:hypothetical protein